jgi:5'-3' exonuclease
MLVDARNCLYRAIYAGLSDKTFIEAKHDFLVIFFRFMNSYIHRFRPSSIHFFWDAPKVEVWRKSIYPAYKDGRQHRCENIDEYLDRCTMICKLMIPYLNSRSYELPQQEADDLIYAFCHMNSNQRIIIISGDGDFRQIPYRFNNIDLFNPLGKSNELYNRANEECDPIELKCFVGETGDNLDGYEQIGKVRAKVLVDDYKKRKEFFQTHDPALYRLNRNLIDLALCPYLDENMIYVSDQLAIDPIFDLSQLTNLVQTHKVRGLLGELKRTVLSFKFVNNVNNV